MGNASRRPPIYAFPNSLLTQHLHIRYPIIQAPMSPITPPNLVAAVSEAGGLGSIAAARMKPEQLKQEIDHVKSLLTNKQPFAVNLFIPKKSSRKLNQQQVIAAQNITNKVQRELTGEQRSGVASSYSLSETENSLEQLYEQQVEVLLNCRVPVFSWTFGIPSLSILQQCKKLGIYTMGTATTPLEAQLLVETEHVDAIIVQGSEAGGHRGTFTTEDEETIEFSNIGLMSLLPLVKAVVPPHVPLIAAGGIMNGTTLLAAMILGASGAQMGTAFLTTTESTLIPNTHRQLLLKANSLISSSSSSSSLNTRQLSESYSPTVLTRVFSGRPARGFPNEMTAAFASDPESILPWGIQSQLLQPLAKIAAEKGDWRYMQLWAGQSYPFCDQKSAAKLIADMIEEAESIIQGFSRRQK